MAMKRVIEVGGKREGKLNAKVLYILSSVLVIAFALLLVVGFENILALLRYRVALFLILGPVIAVFLWCAYKAFGPRGRS